jgi:hypothetical protein
MNCGNSIQAGDEGSNAGGGISRTMEFIDATLSALMMNFGGDPRVASRTRQPWAK